jgi:predicted secreted Zn-dependent protease
MQVLALMLVWALNDSATGPVPVTLSETLDVHHYEVSGLSPEHLVSSFRARPNPSVMATTRAGVSTRYDFAFGNGECRLMQVELALDIDITYPLWREEAQGNDAMRAAWTRFITALEIHEQGHVDLFREAAGELQGRLARLPPAPSCNALAQSIERERQRFDREVNVVQSAYEAQTRNGATQGARLRFR